MTLADLRALLELAHGPAVERLTERDPGAPARAYLPRTIWAYHRPIGTLTMVPIHEVMWGGGEGVKGTLDLTDPGTVHAVKVALALALGLDPGIGSIGLFWYRKVRSGAENTAASQWNLNDTRALDWRLPGRPGTASFVSDVTGGSPPWHLLAPEVATEPDPIKALVLACQHVIKEQE